MTDIHVFQRCLKIAGRDCSYIEQLIEKFHSTLENFSLFLTHYCNGEVDICFNGHRLATLCNRLSHLRSLHFAIQVQFLERATRQILFDFLQAFRTPFWLDGPLGRIKVCVNYHPVFRFVQMYSLPYTFSDNTVFRTIDLIDVLFNYNEEKKEIPNDLPVTFETLSYGMKWLFISFLEKQNIPILFLRALQSPHSQGKRMEFFFRNNSFLIRTKIIIIGKVLVISHERGILPDNHVQLTHFATLQLKSIFDTNSSYDFQRMCADMMKILLELILYFRINQLASFTTECQMSLY